MEPPNIAASNETATFTAGWYPDPMHRFEFRYFNGERWTADVSRQRVRYIDSIGPAALVSQLEDLNSRFPGRFEPAEQLLQRARNR